MSVVSILVCLYHDDDATNSKSDGEIMPGTPNSQYGLSRTRYYHIWNNMKQRCYNPNHIAYPRYGGKGVKICDEWLFDIRNFITWANENGYSDELTLDRIDNDGNYEPNNCRFANKQQQAVNRKTTTMWTYNNETHCLNEWSRILGIGQSTLWYRTHVTDDIELIFKSGGDALC